MAQNYYNKLLELVRKSRSISSLSTFPQTYEKVMLLLSTKNPSMGKVEEALFSKSSMVYWEDAIPEN